MAAVAPLTASPLLHATLVHHSMDVPWSWLTVVDHRRLSVGETAIYCGFLCATGSLKDNRVAEKRVVDGADVVDAAGFLVAAEGVAVDCAAEKGAPDDDRAACSLVERCLVAVKTLVERRPLARKEPAAATHRDVVLCLATAAATLVIPCVDDSLLIVDGRAVCLITGRVSAAAVDGPTVEDEIYLLLSDGLLWTKCGSGNSLLAEFRPAHVLYIPACSTFKRACIIILCGEALEGDRVGKRFGNCMLEKNLTAGNKSICTLSKTANCDYVIVILSFRGVLLFDRGSFAVLCKTVDAQVAEVDRGDGFVIECRNPYLFHAADDRVDEDLEANSCCRYSAKLFTAGVVIIPQVWGFYSSILQFCGAYISVSGVSFVSQFMVGVEDLIMSENILCG